MTVLAIDTPHGRANAHLRLTAEPRAALVLGHGASGGVSAKDLAAVTDVARSEGVSVALVEQPYRVAGRRAPLRRHGGSTPPGRRWSTSCSMGSSRACLCSSVADLWARG